MRKSNRTDKPTIPADPGPRMDDAIWSEGRAEVERVWDIADLQVPVDMTKRGLGS